MGVYPNKDFLVRLIGKVLGSKQADSVSKILKSDINKKIISGSFWVLSGTIISKGLMLLSSIITARILGSEEYGAVGIIRSTVNMFAVFAGLGVGLVVTKYIAELKSTDPERVLRIVKLSNFITLIMGFLISLGVVVFSQKIALQINAPYLSKEIKIGAIILFFNVLCGIQTGMLSGFESYRDIAKNNLISGILSFFVQIIAAYYWGLIGAVIGFGFNYFSLWFFNKLSVSQLVKKLGRFPSLKQAFIETNVLWKFGLPSVLSGLMVGPVTWICNVFIVNQNNGYNEMALFDAANQWRLTMLFIPTALAQIILPMMSSSKSNKTEYKEVFVKNFKVNSLIAMGLFLLILVFSPIIVKSYGSDFNDLYLPLFILSFSTVFVAVNNVLGQYLASQDKMWLGFGFNLLWAFFLILMSYYLIKIKGYGAVGLSISYCISYLLHSVFQFIYLKVKILPKYED